MHDALHSYMERTYIVLKQYADKSNDFIPLYSITTPHVTACLVFLSNYTKT